MVDFYGFYVGEYASPIDPMANGKPSESLDEFGGNPSLL